MKQLDFLPTEYREETLSLLERCLKVADRVRGRVTATTILENLEFIEEKLEENPNYFVNK